MGKGSVFNKNLHYHKAQGARYKVQAGRFNERFTTCTLHLVPCALYLDFLQRTFHFFNLIRFHHISHFIISKILNRQSTLHT
jgi:hypothetical protein